MGSFFWVRGGGNPGWGLINYFGGMLSVFDTFGVRSCIWIKCHHLQRRG